MKVKNSESLDGIGSLILSVITEDIFAGISMEKNQTLTPFRSDLGDVVYIQIASSMNKYCVT